MAGVGVAVVPGGSFYHDPVLGRTQVRFTLLQAGTAREELAP